MLSNLPAFIIAMSLLTITPGLDTLLVIRNTTRGGLRDGFVTSLGICLGLYVHATWSAIGVAAIISQTPALFAGLKTVGALYLVYLGASGLRSLKRGGGLVPTEVSLNQVSQLQSLKEASCPMCSIPRPPFSIWRFCHNLSTKSTLFGFSLCFWPLSTLCWRWCGNVR